MDCRLLKILNDRVKRAYLLTLFELPRTKVFVSSLANFELLHSLFSGTQDLSTCLLHLILYKKEDHNILHVIN